MKPEFVNFGDKQGSGYITDSKDAIEVRPKSVKLAGMEISPGMTSLNGFFCRMVEYLGLRDKNEMIFYLGADDAGLFGTKHYFQSVLWVAENRIFEMFGPNFGRDFYFIGGVWK